MPAELVQSADKYVASPAIVLTDFAHTLLGALQRENGRNLNWSECSVVEITFETGQGGNQLLVAHHKAHTPPGHVVALREGEELDSDFSSTRNLQNGRSLVSIETDVSVRQIMHKID